MPTYNYKCSKCGNVFDIEATLQEKEEGSEKFICPKCESREIKQIFSGVNFIKSDSRDADEGCCSGGDICDTRCRPDENNSDGCDDKKGGSGCCG